jgi:DNA-binding transcriptional LysR family regulator
MLEAPMRRDRDVDFHARQLRAVLAVAEYRSFVAAAAALRLSQPTLTRTVKQVEDRLGVALFNRTTREVAVTEAGKEFAALAERLLNDLRIGVEGVRSHTREPRGQIVVSSVLSLANLMLPSLIAGCRRRFGGIEIHLREGLQNQVRDEVRSGIADFGVCFADRLPANVAAEPIGTERLRVVMPAAHALAARRAIGLAMLADLPLVSLPAESRTRQMLDRAAGAAATPLLYVMTANRLPTIFSLVRNGVGVTVVTASECPPAADRTLAARPLVAPAICGELAIVRLRERELGLAAAALIGVVKKGLRPAGRGDGTA